MPRETSQATLPQEIAGLQTDSVLHFVNALSSLGKSKRNFWHARGYLGTLPLIEDSLAGKQITRKDVRSFRRYAQDVEDQTTGIYGGCALGIVGGGGFGIAALEYAKESIQIAGGRLLTELQPIGANGPTAIEGGAIGLSVLAAVGFWKWAANDIDRSFARSLPARAAGISSYLQDHLGDLEAAVSTIEKVPNPRVAVINEVQNLLHTMESRTLNLNDQSRRKISLSLSETAAGVMIDMLKGVRRSREDLPPTPTTSSAVMLIDTMIPSEEHSGDIHPWDIAHVTPEIVYALETIAYLNGDHSFSDIVTD